MKKIIYTKHAPKPIGPYNQAILIKDTLYGSGQIAINPLTNNLIVETIELETSQVMENIKAILNEAKMTFDNIVKTTIFITDMSNFNSINTIYATYFKEETAPARETVEVSGLPKGVNVEISFIAMQ